MTHGEMLLEYTRCQQNILSSWAEHRMEELDAMAESEGLLFHMVNETAYMNPHFIGKPIFELVPATL